MKKIHWIFIILMIVELLALGGLYFSRDNFNICNHMVFISMEDIVPTSNCTPSYSSAYTLSNYIIIILFVLTLLTYIIILISRYFIQLKGGKNK